MQAQALVMESVAGVARQVGTGGDAGVDVRNAAGVMPWKANVRMLVLAPDRRPIQIWPTLRMSRHKYAVAGTLVPVVLDPVAPERTTVDWDAVPDLDASIAAGAEVFTDPDAARARLDAAQRAFSGAPPPPGDAGADIRPGEPTARVLAVSPGQLRFEVLLSVAVPGRPRHGVRWHGRIPYGTYIPEWGEIPVRVESGGDVEIPWERLQSRLEHARGRADAMGERLEALLAAPSGPAWTPGVPFAPPATPRPDSAALLEQLAQLHAAGALTDAELAAERARVLHDL